MMLKKIKDKKAGFTDLFIFMIFAFVIVLVSGVMIYIGVETEDQLQESLGGRDDLSSTEGNASETIDATIGVTNTSFKALYWITAFLIGGMIISIFIGSFLVTTKPVFFIPYIFITIIAIVVSVPISNAYETLINKPTMSSTFAEFTASNWIMLHLPVWVTIIGFIGGIIIFTRMNREQEVYGYG